MNRRLKLGFDNYAIRALGWKAPRLIDYAAALRLDALLLSDLDVFESLEVPYLRELKARADDRGLEIHAGILSICPSSALFDRRRGTPERQLKQAIQTAKSLGSPVARCVLGIAHDRRNQGGIEACISETVRVLKKLRSFALDAGVRVAVENHAGDMQARELVSLIEQAGRDFVGATMDSGNAAWALEDPLCNLDILGPYALTTGIRDSALWETPDGAMLQWTAMGEGNVDFKAYFKRFAQLCPDTPVILETISGRPIPIPFLRDEFWDAYPNVLPREFARFLRLIRGGRPRRARRFGKSRRARSAEMKFQQAELERSVRYCKEVLGLGLKK